ncbi:MAG: HEAT repeat domain-containing protein [Gammaproteobacteria bacterium]|nr:HEAT repeat domain-containing protein [Gammaproteobacteria bacterium]
MSEAANNKGAGMSSAQWWLSLLGIRPDEKEATALLCGNMFLSGIAIGMIRICAFTLFLEHFSSDRLALVAILLAVTGTLVTLAIDRGTRYLSIGGYVFTVLGTILSGVVILRILLGISDSASVIFFLPLFFEVVYMLFQLQFLTLLSRLLNVRQSKRLSGITRSGEFQAEMVGGLSIAMLLNFMSVPDLLLVAATATIGVYAIVAMTIRRFGSQLAKTTQDFDNDDEDSGRMLTMLKLPYVKLISLCYAAYIFSYFFIEVAFYGYASMQFSGDRALAAFLGQFYAACGLITLLAMIFGFAPFLRRFGILGGVIAFPAAVGLGSLAVSTLEFIGAEMLFIFGIMVVTNGVRFILQAAIWRPSVAILFQVLPDRQRARGTALIEGFIDPLSGGIAGICLFVLSDWLNWEPKFFLLLLTALLAIWFSVGFIVRRMYLSHLVVSIRKRKLGELSLQELDNASLDIIKKGLNSPYPAEIFYCLNILEEVEHPEITEMLKTVIASDNSDVRMNVLQRIARLAIKPLQGQVMMRIEAETDTAVKGQALKTYAALGAPDVIEVLSPYLRDDHPELRSGALVGILRHQSGNEEAQDYLLRMIRSADDEDRSFAATTIGEIGSAEFSGFLIELLEDNNTDVLNEAIRAAGNIDDDRLIDTLVQKLSNPKLQGRATLALQRFGEAALYPLELGFTAPAVARQVKRQIIDVIREIGGVTATELLLRHIDIEQPELRHQVYLALATLHYQADPDDQYVFVNKLEEEVQQIAWLLAAMEDLYANEDYHELTAALGQELDQHRDNMLLLVSFLFPSIVMLDTRANIDSKVSELRVFALEVLDNLLTPEIKEVVLPILDDLTVSERLIALRPRYPQDSMSANDRFHRLVEEHFDERFFWSQATLLYLIGESESIEHLETVKRSLHHSEPIVRETASWALARLDPPDVERLLRPRQDDPDANVRAVASELLTTLKTKLA